MKKIIIDNFVFNRAIKSGKYEVAEFLLENECPCNFSAYLQVLEIPVFEWLDKHGVSLIEENLSLYLVEKTRDIAILDWFFINKKITISSDTIKHCISNGDTELIKVLLNYGYKLRNLDYITASLNRNIEILDLLKENNCPFNKEVEDQVLLMGDKVVLKWFIKNDLI